MRLLFFLLPLFLALSLTASWGQNQSASDNSATKITPTPTNPQNLPVLPMQPISDFNRLADSNRELLELLKKQQAVLEDMQADRSQQIQTMNRLQNRLEEALKENADLRAQLAQLQAQSLATTPAPTPAPASSTPDTSTTSSPLPAAPESHLPPVKDLFPGEVGWHRILMLTGTDSQKTALFHITNKVWRVLWYNEDPVKNPNTSALFINAFPKDDTIPQKVIEKLGTGSGESQLVGPGNYYLNIEASGGKWEVAVEDLQ